MLKAGPHTGLFVRSSGVNSVLYKGVLLEVEAWKARFVTPATWVEFSVHVNSAVVLGEATEEHPYTKLNMQGEICVSDAVVRLPRSRSVVSLTFGTVLCSDSVIERIPECQASESTLVWMEERALFEVSSKSSMKKSSTVTFDEVLKLYPKPDQRKTLKSVENFGGRILDSKVAADAVASLGLSATAEYSDDCRGEDSDVVSGVVVSSYEGRLFARVGHETIMINLKSRHRGRPAAVGDFVRGRVLPVCKIDAVTRCQRIFDEYMVIEPFMGMLTDVGVKSSALERAALKDGVDGVVVRHSLQDNSLVVYTKEGDAVLSSASECLNSEFRPKQLMGAFLRLRVRKEETPIMYEPGVSEIYMYNTLEHYWYGSHKCFPIGVRNYGPFSLFVLEVKYCPDRDKYSAGDGFIIADDPQRCIPAPISGALYRCEVKACYEQRTHELSWKIASLRETVRVPRGAQPVGLLPRHPLCPPEPVRSIVSEESQRQRITPTYKQKHITSEPRAAASPPARTRTSAIAHRFGAPNIRTESTVSQSAEERNDLRSHAFTARRFNEVESTSAISAEKKQECPETVAMNLDARDVTQKPVWADLAEQGQFVGLVFHRKNFEILSVTSLSPYKHPPRDRCIKGRMHVSKRDPLVGKWVIFNVDVNAQSIGTDTSKKPTILYADIVRVLEKAPAKTRNMRGAVEMLLEVTYCGLLQGTTHVFHHREAFGHVQYEAPDNVVFSPGERYKLWCMFHTHLNKLKGSCFSFPMPMDEDESFVYGAEGEYTDDDETEVEQEGGGAICITKHGNGEENVPIIDSGCASPIEGSPSSAKDAEVGEELTTWKVLFERVTALTDCKDPTTKS